MYDWAQFRHFRYLLVILEKQGLRVAADELHTSQPNLTVQARQFQEYSSVRLFRRTKSGRIRPTDAGLAFISFARLLLDTRDEVIEALVAIERGEIGAAIWLFSVSRPKFIPPLLRYAQRDSSYALFVQHMETSAISPMRLQADWSTQR